MYAAKRWRIVLWLLCLGAAGIGLSPKGVSAQENPPAAVNSAPPAVEQAAASRIGSEQASNGSEQAPVGETSAAERNSPSRSGMNFLQLLVLGGWFMIPLGLISVAVVALAIERGLVLRRDRQLPDRLLARLGQLCEQPGGLDPRDAYRICQSLPSSASTVLRKVLLKVGRPHAELEQTLQDAAQRNAIRQQQPVSWLTWCAAVAPLLGLLGTVWGITQAFYDTTQLEVGENQAEALASGIYMALVTTIFGLLIAIPATTFAHYYENRIVTYSNEIEELIGSLLPQLERYEGQVRFAGESKAESPDRSTLGKTVQGKRTDGSRT
ncbi:MAG: MotA/TolQ/ExbB proton channel family protein [Planctomycetota bacterium]